MRAFLLALSLTVTAAVATPAADAPLVGFTPASSVAERETEHRVDAALAG